MPHSESGAVRSKYRDFVRAVCRECAFALALAGMVVSVAGVFLGALMLLARRILVPPECGALSSLPLDTARTLRAAMAEPYTVLVDEVTRWTFIALGRFAVLLLAFYIGVVVVGALLGLLERDVAGYIGASARGRRWHKACLTCGAMVMAASSLVGCIAITWPGPDVALDHRVSRGVPVIAGAVVVFAVLMFVLVFRRSKRSRKERAEIVADYQSMATRRSLTAALLGGLAAALCFSTIYLPWLFGQVSRTQARITSRIAACQGDGAVAGHPCVQAAVADATKGVHRPFSPEEVRKLQESVNRILSHGIVGAAFLLTFTPWYAVAFSIHRWRGFLRTPLMGARWLLLPGALGMGFLLDRLGITSQSPLSFFSVGLSLTVADAFLAHNETGGAEVVFFVVGGRRFHSNRDCPALQRSLQIKRIGKQEAARHGLRQCSLCSR